MINSILILTSGLYVFVLILLRIGLRKAQHYTRVHGFEPSVSVIVAARNEEARIGECLSSLIQLDYPPSKLEIIIVDDQSSDTTPEIVCSFIRHHQRGTLVTATSGKGNLRGKANAVAQGIGASSGEVLMFTDADCTVPPGWIRETLTCFDPETGVVGGFTALDSTRIFEGIQALDWLFLFGLASASAGWNIPLTAIGNNLSVRRSAYEATGGYENIPFSVTEDYSLVRAIIDKTGYKIRFPLNSGALVHSKACQSWQQLYHQKQRWGVGGLDMVPAGVFIMAVGWIAKLCILVSLAAGSIPPGIAALLVVSAIEFTYVARIMKQLGLPRLSRFFLPFIPYFSAIVLSLPFIAYLSKEVVWKEISHKGSGK